MAIGDGSKIGIRFTQPLVGDVSGNETAFTVSFQEYDFVPGGALNNIQRPVASVSPQNTVELSPPMSGAVLTDTELNSGIIGLAVVEEEDNGELQ